MKVFITKVPYQALLSLFTEEEPAPNFIPTFKTNVESFSFYLHKDRKLDKGPKVEVNSYSQVGFTLDQPLYCVDCQASFAEIGQLNYKDGRYISKSGGIFMVNAFTFKG